MNNKDAALKALRFGELTRRRTISRSITNDFDRLIRDGEFPDDRLEDIIEAKSIVMAQDMFDLDEFYALRDELRKIAELEPLY